MTARAMLEELGPLTTPMREVRFIPLDDLEELTDEEAVAAIRALRGLAYSANEGARHLERWLRNHRTPGGTA